MLEKNMSQLKVSWTDKTGGLDSLHKETAYELAWMRAFVNYVRRHFHASEDDAFSTAWCLMQKELENITEEDVEGWLADSAEEEESRADF